MFPWTAPLRKNRIRTLLHALKLRKKNTSLSTKKDSKRNNRRPFVGVQTCVVSIRSDPNSLKPETEFKPPINSCELKRTIDVVAKFSDRGYALSIATSFCLTAKEIDVFEHLKKGLLRPICGIDDDQKFRL